MAEKKEYIDRKAFMNSFVIGGYRGLGTLLGVDILKRLAEFQTADVVEVVRCKDCHFWDREDSSGYEKYNNYVCACRFWSDAEVAMTSYTRPTDFCSHGEKAED